MALSELSLFTGCGGGLLGSKLLGWRTVCAVEHNPYRAAVLNARQEDELLEPFPIMSDVRGVNSAMVDMAVSAYTYGCQLIQEDDMPAHRKNFDEAVVMYERGLSIADVANFYGMSRQAMHKILVRRGVRMRDRLKYKGENHFFRGGRRASDRAHNLIERAIAIGVLTRKEVCEKCKHKQPFKDGRSGIQAHHDDYNRPLDVKWLCQKCHHEWHKKHRAKREKRSVPKKASVDIITAGFP